MNGWETLPQTDTSRSDAIQLQPIVEYEQQTHYIINKHTLRDQFVVRMCFQVHFLHNFCVLFKIFLKIFLKSFLSVLCGAAYTELFSALTFSGNFIIIILIFVLLYSLAVLCVQCL